MDPKITMESLRQALIDRDWQEVSDCVDALLAWLRSGGSTKNLWYVDYPEKPVPMGVYALITKLNTILKQLMEG